MILADSSIWVEHLRGGDDFLARALIDTEILIHPYIIGELALGHLKNRAGFLADLEDMTQITVTSHSETLFFIEQNSLMGKGVGWVDASLLASVALSRTARIWSRDQKLNRVAKELGMEWEPE